VKLAQEQENFCSFIKQHMHKHKTNCSRKHIEIADSCFMDNGILWRRLLRHINKNTVIVVPQILTQKVIADTHGDFMTGHESTNITKERIYHPIGGQAWTQK
jgi:hypothetical protein